MLMPLGQYKGKNLEDLPSDYLRWALENMERLDSPLQAEMENQLVLREGEGVVRQKGRLG